MCFFFANLLRSHDLQEGTLESSSIIPNPWKDQCSYAILWSFQLWLFWLKGMEESSQLDPMEQVVNGTSSPLCADARRGQAPCGLYGGSGGCKSCPVALSVVCTSTCMIKLYKATCAWHVVTHSVFWKCWREGCVLLSVDSTQKSTAVLLWPCLASLRLPNVRRKRRPRGFGCERTKALWNCGILGCQLLEHDVKITGAWATRPWPQGGFVVSKQFQNSLPNKKHFTSESYTVDRHCKIHPNVIFLHRYIPVSSHGLTNHLSEAASQGDGTWVALQGPFSAIPPAIGGSLASCARQSEPVASTLWPNAVAGAVRSIQNAARTWRPNRHWDECWTKDNYPWPMHRHKPHKRKHLQPKHHSFVAETSQVPCSSAFHDDPWQLPHFLWRPLRSQSAPPDEVIK